MSYHQRPHEVRLAISSEAEALIFCSGHKAYAEARRRAEEASSDFLARDWNEVAFVIARKTMKRRRCSLGHFINWLGLPASTTSQPNKQLSTAGSSFSPFATISSVPSGNGR
jgi:hypothetical protein